MAVRRQAEAGCSVRSRCDQHIDRTLAPVQRPGAVGHRPLCVASAACSCDVPCLSRALSADDQAVAHEAAHSAAPPDAAPAPSSCASKDQPSGSGSGQAAPVLVLYGSAGGTCKRLAQQLASRLASTASAAPPAAKGCCGGGAAEPRASTVPGSTACCRSATASAPAAEASAAGCCQGGSPSARSGTAAAAGPAPAVEVRCLSLAQYEPEQLLAEPRGTAVLLLLSTYEGGTPPESARWFCRWDRGRDGVFMRSGVRSVEAPVVCPA